MTIPTGANTWDLWPKWSKFGSDFDEEERKRLKNNKTVYNSTNWKQYLLFTSERNYNWICSMSVLWVVPNWRHNIFWKQILIQINQNTTSSKKVRFITAINYLNLEKKWFPYWESSIPSVKTKLWDRDYWNWSYIILNEFFLRIIFIAHKISLIKDPCDKKNCYWKYRQNIDDGI